MDASSCTRQRPGTKAPSAARSMGFRRRTRYQPSVAKRSTLREPTVQDRMSEAKPAPVLPLRIAAGTYATVTPVKPLDLTLELAPKSRFDIVDLRARFADEHRAVADFTHCLYWSF